MALDALLNDALADARTLIRSYFNHDLWEADIDWEQPAMLIGGTAREKDARVSHAIGFVHGVALALDMTALQLLAEVPDPDPVYRCACSWVGSDPDVRRGKPPTCPACWHHDKKRVPLAEGGRPVTPTTVNVPNAPYGRRSHS